MPEVIADTSPLQYLHLAKCLHLLPALYSEILVPQGVAEEVEEGLALGHSLPILQDLGWLRIVAVPQRRLLMLANDLGKGEREVLYLAVERQDSLAILDDGLARRMAKHLSVAFTGTLGVLLRAKKSGHLGQVKPVIDRMHSLGFHLDGKTRAAILDMANES